MPVSGPPNDRELLDALEGPRGGARVGLVSRRPHGYATSAPLEEVRIEVGDESRDLILKELSRDRLPSHARSAKPAFVHQPLRELETYRRILAPAGLGPRLYAAADDDDRSRCWILIERVPDAVLWQVGELSVWEQAAAWLAGMHARFAGRAEELRAANPHLLDHTHSWYRLWGERARAALAGSDDPRGPVLLRALAGYEGVATALAALPRTFIHGELYPANVMVVREQDGVGVFPIDWEMAATGPGLIDLAALVSGWEEADRARLVAAYERAAKEAGMSLPVPIEVDLSRCRLHLALQWVGWSADWEAPEEHAHDWLGEALTLTRELGLA